MSCYKHLVRNAWKILLTNWQYRVYEQIEPYIKPDWVIVRIGKLTFVSHLVLTCSCRHFYHYHSLL